MPVLSADPVLEVINWAIAFVLACMFVWYGVRLAIQNLSNLMPGIGISAFWQYMAVPVSGVLIVVALVEIAALARRPVSAVEGAPR